MIMRKGRMTREKDQYECRIAGGCPTALWLEGHNIEVEDEAELCEDCPFEKYINKLAEFEDREIYLYDDCK